MKPILIFLSCSYFILNCASTSEVWIQDAPQSKFHKIKGRINAGDDSTVYLTKPDGERMAVRRDKIDFVFHDGSDHIVFGSVGILMGGLLAFQLLDNPSANYDGLGGQQAASAVLILKGFSFIGLVGGPISCYIGYQKIKSSKRRMNTPPETTDAGPITFSINPYSRQAAVQYEWAF